MHTESLNLQTAVVFLVAAGLIVPLLSRLRISPVLGFLAVGLVIGPFGLARFADVFPWLSYVVIKDVEGVRALAELGVVFLLFMIGLELSPDRLLAMRSSIFGLGTAQVVTTATVIAIAASFLGANSATAMIIGASLALSSTAIVMELLIENRRIGSPAGQTVFAVLLLQDLAVLPILLMVGALAAGTSGSPLLAFATSILQAALAIVVILILGRYLVPPLLRILGAGASRDMFIATILLVIIGTSVATAAAGLSLALGAFLAGLLFAKTEYRHEIEVDIAPFKGLLLALFFMSVGMSIDLTEVAGKPLLLTSAVLGLFLIKGVIFYMLARLFSRPPAVAAESALLLGQGGEFAFLVVAIASSLSLIPNSTAQFLLIVTGLTMLATPLVARLAREIALRIEVAGPHEMQQDEVAAPGPTGHIIIVGYGRVGCMLGSILDTHGIQHFAIDKDTSIVSTFRRQGAPVYYGDAHQPQILKSFSIDRATALVLTMNEHTANERVAAAARRLCPMLPIYARAHDGEQARRLLAQGANHVVPETIEASLQLSEMVLVACGISDDTARRMIDTRRQAENANIELGRVGE